MKLCLFCRLLADAVGMTAESNGIDWNSGTLCKRTPPIHQLHQMCRSPWSRTSCGWQTWINFSEHQTFDSIGPFETCVKCVSCMFDVIPLNWIGAPDVRVPPKSNTAVRLLCVCARYSLLPMQTNTYLARTFNLNRVCVPHKVRICHFCIHLVLEIASLQHCQKGNRTNPMRLIAATHRAPSLHLSSASERNTRCSQHLDLTMCLLESGKVKMYGWKIVLCKWVFYTTYYCV